MGASRFNIALADVPQTVVVLNEQLIRDVGTSNLHDVAKYVSGVNSASTPSNGQLALRGYNIPGASMVNGLPDSRNVAGNNVFDPALVNRVEIIKGPAGTLYGAHTLGGVINRVTKQPNNRQRSTTLKAIADSTETYRFELDATGPATTDGKLAYRLIAVEQEGKMHWGGVNNDRRVFSFLADYRASEHSAFRFRSEILKIRSGGEASQWFIDRNGTISMFLGADFHSAEFDELQKIDVYFGELEFEHAFELSEARWAFRAVVRASQHDVGGQANIPTNAFALNSSGSRIGNIMTLAFDDPQIGNYEITRLRRHQFPDSKNIAAFFDVSGSFKLGPVDNQLLLYLSGSGENESQQMTEYVYPSIWVYNQTFLADPLAARGAGTLRQNTASNSHSFATGVQNNFSILDNRLIFVAGARYDWMQSNNNDYRQAIFTSETEQDWSFRHGIVAKPLKGMSLFYNNGQTFNPVSGLDERTNLPLKNLEGSIDEFGFKLELFNHSLVATASWFDMSLKNAIINVSRLDDPEGIGYRTQAGVHRTDGWEADIAWQPNPRWALIAGIGDITSKNENNQRNRNVANGFNYRLLAKYSQPTGVLAGLSIGAGYVFVNDRAGDTSDTFNLPDYATYDMFVSYRRGDWEFQVNAYNLTDEVYAQTSVNSRRIFAGEPRRIRGSVSYRF